MTRKKDLSTWNSSFLSDATSKQNLGAVGTQKFQLIKEYLASLIMKDAQEMLASKRKGVDCSPDSLKEIRLFFNSFFKPMEFVDVHIDCSPFKYIIKTPKGEIDIDDLSSGEKEILNTYIHFHQLMPQNAIILFDEVDAHLHPDLGRRYLHLFRQMSDNNQLILTTHSPEVMVAAGADSLFTLDKVQCELNANQLNRVSTNDELHNSLSEIMGTNGMVSINKKVVFLEGNESSADRNIFESLFPPSSYNISFIPVGNSSLNRRIAERVNLLLSSTGTFQSFFSIVDKDIVRSVEPQSPGRLFILPVYHVENFLLNNNLIYDACSKLLLDKNPYKNENEVDKHLKALLFDDRHFLPFTRAIYDAEVEKIAKIAWDNVYKKNVKELSKISIPTFEDIKTKSRNLLDESIKSNKWKAVCKGRDILKTFCSANGIKYEHFRNIIISNMKTPPEDLDKIIKEIMSNKI